MKRARLADVASLAGVSAKTVSNVVHGFEHVSETTRARVQSAIDELGYRPDVRGRSLVTGKTGVIALALADVRIPYFAELSHVVASLAGRRGYRLLLEQTDGTLEGERVVTSQAEAGLVDGVLFQPSQLTATEIAMRRRDVPMVLLGEGVPLPSVDHVMIDNVAAARAATVYLARLGCRRIGFLGHEDTDQIATSKLRLLGYQQGLEDAGLMLDMSLLIPTDAVTAEAAAAAADRALQRGIDLDGLVCRDDLAAIGVLHALTRHGLRVPEDIAVIGWDDVPMAKFTTPALTTVQPNLGALAASALDMLEERIAGYDGIGRHRTVDWRLTIRESAPMMTSH